VCVVISTATVMVATDNQARGNSSHILANFGAERGGGGRGMMLNKRQQLQQQHLIYGGGTGIMPLRGYRTELLRQAQIDMPPKRTKETTVTLPPANQGQRASNSGNSNNNSSINSNASSGQSPVRSGSNNRVLTQSNNSAKNSSAQKPSDVKTLLQRTSELRTLYNVAQRSASQTNAKVGESSGKNSSGNSSDKENVSGKPPRKPRPPVYIPPINYPSVPVPRNVVTIDTSKARGNTDVIRLVARDLGWREVSAVSHLFLEKYKLTGKTNANRTELFEEHFNFVSSQQFVLSPHCHVSAFLIGPSMISRGLINTDVRELAD
jgi:hypothetical protein